MKNRLNQLLFAAFVLRLQIAVLGLKVWMRERAYHALTRYAYRTGMILCDVDPNDPKFKEAVAAAVAEAKAALETKNQELIAEVRALKRNSKDGIDPKEVERLETELDALRAQVKDADKAIKDATKRADTAEKSLQTEQAHTQRLLVDNGLAAALTEAGVMNPVMHKAAAAMIRSGQKIEIAVDGENRLAKVGDQSLGDFVKAWAQGDEGKAFVAAPGHGGGGAPGSGRSGGPANPWAKESFNMTEQGKMLQTNPTLARSMAAEHGVTLP